MAATTVKYSTTFPLKNGGESSTGSGRLAKQRLAKGNPPSGSGQLETLGRQSSSKFSGPTLDLVSNANRQNPDSNNGDHRKEYPLLSSVNIVSSGTPSSSSHGKYSGGEGPYSPLERKLQGTTLRVDSVDSPNGSSQTTPQLPDVNLRRQNSINTQSPILKSNTPTANNFMSPLPAKANSEGALTQGNNFHQPTPPISNNTMKSQPQPRQHQQLQYQQGRPKEIPQHPLNWEDCRMEFGLDNLGNTCFMNSSLQCLLHIKPLVQYFMKGAIDKDINPTSPKKGMLATSFLHLVYEVSNGKPGCAVAPNNFHRAVAVFAPYLMEYQQQDSQEFLRFLLDGMSEDLCRRRPIGQQSTTKLNTSASTTLQILDCATPERSDSHLGRTSATQLPNLSHSHTEQPQSSPQGDLVGGGGKRSNLSQRLRLETQTMRQSDSIEKIASNQLLQLATCGDDDIQLSADEDDSAPRHGASDTPAKEPEPKLRVVKDVKEVRAASSEDMTTEEGAGIAVMTDGAESPRDKNSSRASGSAPSSARNSVTQSLSNSLRGVKMRIKRSIGSHDGDESNPKHTADDIAVVSQTPQRSHSSRMESITNIPSTDKELEVLEAESKQAWERYLKLNDSIITDIFGGLLQNTIQCLTCNHRSFAFDPFLDLSVPISKESEGATGSKGLFGTLRQAVGAPTASDNRSTLEKCLEKFTAEEVLDGENMVTCEQCNKKRKSVKRLSIFRYPKVLVVHIKRFRFSTTSREKLSTDVHFPLAALDLRPYLSPDLSRLTHVGQHRAISSLPPVVKSHNNNHHESEVDDADHSHLLVASTSTPHKSTSHHDHHNNTAQSSPSKHIGACDSIVHSNLNPLYDLIGVCNHHGSLNGGHYIAHVDTNYGRSAEKAPRWMCFNDERVSKANASSIAGPTAYVLFYKLREDANLNSYYASQNQEEATNAHNHSHGHRGQDTAEADQEGSDRS